MRCELSWSDAGSRCSSSCSKPMRCSRACQQQTSRLRGSCTAMRCVPCTAPRALHHDVKPDNIIVADDGDLRLIDFGIVRRLETRSYVLRCPYSPGTCTFQQPCNSCTIIHARTRLHEATRFVRGLVYHTQDKYRQKRLPAFLLFWSTSRLWQFQVHLTSALHTSLRQLIQNASHKHIDKSCMVSSCDAQP
jgi:serine/threonine protein kinase